MLFSEMWAKMGNRSMTFLGKHHSQDSKQKIGQSRLGDNNPAWKGDNVGLVALHVWVREHIAEPKLCQVCHKATPNDLANITSIYNRDAKNWQYQCRSCHMLFDYKMGFRKGRQLTEEARKRISKSLKERRYNK